MTAAAIPTLVRWTGWPAAVVAAVLALRWLVEGRAAWPHAGLAGMAVAISLLVLRLERVHADRSDLRRSLAARLDELAALHSLGAELGRSFDPARVFASIERECREALDPDFFFLALADRAGTRLEAVYRQRRGERPDLQVLPLERGLAVWAAREKRAIRIDDFPDGALPAQPPGELLEQGVRSLLAVPMIFEDRVIGVLSAQSLRPKAFDHHQLALLTTVARQTALAIQNARHYEMATVDSLTRLFLREHFFGRLRDEYRRVRRYGGNFAVLMIDLDDFKPLNDRYGHAAGDRYLRAIGGAIRRRLRAADIGCRYGGDEFALLLPETDLAGARAIAERLRVEIAGLRVEVEGRRLHATASIGLATYRDHDAGDPQGLLQRADEALYQAKHSGRDRVVPYAA